MNKVTGITEPLLISFFITELEQDIRHELQFNRPASLMEAFSIARAYAACFEDNNSKLKNGSRGLISFNSGTFVGPALHGSPPSPSPVSRFPKPSQPPSNTSPTSPSTPMNPKLPPLLPTPSLPIRRLSQAKLCDKCEQGLCYNCDEKFGPNHRCRSKFLLLIGCDKDDSALGELEETTQDHDEEISGDISNLYALSSHQPSYSLRLFGSYGLTQFHVSIDNGSTHNFIKPELVERLGLPLHTIPRFRVSTGSDVSIACQHNYPVTSLVLQGIMFTVDLFVLAIEGPKVVLGFPWLQTVGWVSHDYLALTMDF